MKKLSCRDRQPVPSDVPFGQCQRHRGKRHLERYRHGFQPAGPEARQIRNRHDQRSGKRVELKSTINIKTGQDTKRKPAFTELLPIHSGYVGGDDYFVAPAENDPRSYLFVEAARDEQDALRRPDQRRIRQDRVLDSPNTRGLVRAIMTFVLAACLRRWQQADVGEKRRKYAMVIHNDTQKAAHAWQDQVIEWVFDAATDAATNHRHTLRPIFDAAYADLKASIEADKGRTPKSNEAFDMFIDALQGGDVVRERVNSDTAVMALLDERAELKLRIPFNVFIGGNILDRGITIPNLIAFYYGRNPRTMQADTVLQHSRMYGNRDRRDLAVTRFSRRATFTTAFTRSMSLKTPCARRSKAARMSRAWSSSNPMRPTGCARVRRTSCC